MVISPLSPTPCPGQHSCFASKGPGRVQSRANFCRTADSVPGARGPLLVHLSCNSTKATISLHFEKTEAHYLRYHFCIRMLGYPNHCNRVPRSLQPSRNASIFSHSPGCVQTATQQPRIHVSSGAVIFSLWPLRTQHKGN